MKGKKEPLRKFNSPINIGGIRMSNPVERKSVDELTDDYLSERRRRKLEEAKEAELDLAAEQSKTETARQRKERELIESGQISPIKGEEVTMESVNERVEDAAEVAAEAAGAGIDPQRAKDLATGKSRIIIVQPDGGRKTDAEAIRERAERIEQAKALYSSCIDAGGDPKRCADMIAGLIPTQSGPSSPPATSVTELIDALVKLDALRGSNTVLADLKASFDNLANEIRQGGGKGNQSPLDPVAFAKQQAEAFGAWRKVIDEFTPHPPASAVGEPLENVKEKNRHEEKMEEIKDERDYHGRITDIAGEIPEGVGYGLAKRFGEERKSRGGDGDGGLKHMLCTEKGCGTKINFTPESEAITCPKCGMVYERKKETETE